MSIVKNQSTSFQKESSWVLEKESNPRPTVFFVYTLATKVAPILFLILFLMISLSGIFRFLFPNASFPLVFATQIGGILLPTLLWSYDQQKKASSFPVEQLQRNSSANSWLRVLIGNTPCSFQLMVGSVLFGSCCSLLFLFVLEPIFTKWLPPSSAELKSWIDFIKPDAKLSHLLMNMIGFALLPAICEEFFFRGLLFSLFLPQKIPTLKAEQQAITSDSKKIMVSQAQIASKQAQYHSFAFLTLIFTALLFGIYHFSVAKFLPTTFLGLAFGLARLVSGSLVPSMIMHFMNNALVLALVAYHYEKIPSALQPILIPVALCMGGVSLWVLHKTHQKNQ